MQHSKPTQNDRILDYIAENGYKYMDMIDVS